MDTISRRDLLRAGTAAALGFGLGIGRGASAAAGEAGTSTPTSASPATGALADLRKKLKGRLLLPGDKGFAAASAPANGRYRNIRPMAVAQCADERDIVTCITWSRAHGVPPVGRNGGHSYAGFSTTTGLLIDIGRLNTVAIDRRHGTAVVGGGALNHDVFAATADGPLFLPVGTCLGVGVGGLVLGGGIGYNTHSAGLTCDHLRASQVVTAAGDLLQLDASHHSDLFWACRGGAGGSFGINTSFTFELVPVPQRKVTYFRFDWRGADAAAAVLAAFHTILRTAPPALNAVAMAQATPVGRGGPREAIDVFSRGQYIGPIGELRTLVRPLLAAAPPTKSTIEEKTFWEMQRMFATQESAPHSWGDISRYAAQPLPDRAVSKLVDLLAACPSRTATANGSLWSLGWIGGNVVNSIRRTATAYVHRNMLTLLRPTTAWEDNAPASVGDGLIAWTDEMIAAMAPHTPNESYQNFPNRRIVDWEHAYYAENFQRLVDVKRKYDDGNLFHNAQSIPPRRLLQRPGATPTNAATLA